MPAISASVSAGEVSRISRPTAIVARTVKGKGVSFMENNNEFHGVAPTQEEAVRALKELGET
jgi:transketolase